MIEHRISGHRAFTVVELHALLGGARSQAMLYTDARRGVLRLEGGAAGRVVTEPHARAYAARLGLDFDAMLSAHEAAEAARAEVLAEREERTRGALFDRPDGDPAQGTRER